MKKNLWLCLVSQNFQKKFALKTVPPLTKHTSQYKNLHPFSQTKHTLCINEHWDPLPGTRLAARGKREAAVTIKPALRLFAVGILSHSVSHDAVPDREKICCSGALYHLCYFPVWLRALYVWRDTARSVSSPRGRARVPFLLPAPLLPPARSSASRRSALAAPQGPRAGRRAAEQGPRAGRPRRARAEPDRAPAARIRRGPRAGEGGGRGGSGCRG